MGDSEERPATHTAEATLYINNEPVGVVLIRRIRPSWSYGEFRSADAFARFAPRFRSWARLMHAGRPYERLTNEISDGLREAEFEIDRLHARLHVLGRNEWIECAQLNIDGTMIEWKAL